MPTKKKNSKKATKSKKSNLKWFDVSVEKKMYATGKIRFKAENSDMALQIVRNKIEIGEIQTSEVEWDEPQYEYCSFDTTGDVD
ncbi:MAG: hypothetical protein WC119_00910 [Synergistaceae bacterium]